MKFLDLFAGIGGFRLGMEAAGHECIGFCEIDPFARKSYKAIHDTEGEIELHDITRVTDESVRGIGSVDIICGGFPCQAFSIAGKRAGFEDTRGTLFFEIARFASILRPKYLFLENVTGLLNHEGGATFETIIGTLDELGYDAEWQVFNSKNFGVPQNRERVFIIGHLRGAGGRAIFPFGGESSESYFEPRIDIIGSTQSEESQSLGQRDIVYSSEGIMGCLTATDYKGPKQVAIPVLTPDVVQIGNIIETESFGGNPQRGRIYCVDGISPCLSTMQGGGLEPKIAIKEATARGYSEATIGDSVNLSHPNSATRRGRVGKQMASTLLTGEEQGVVMPNFRIRKLTPRECWRLQGLPDWAFDMAQAVNSNSQLYKQAGNSVTVNVIEAIARRL